jgi:hypothetical protein
MRGVTRRQFIGSGSAFAAATAIQPLLAPAALSQVVPDFATMLHIISACLKAAVGVAKLFSTAASETPNALLERCSALVQKQDLVLSEVRKIGITISDEAERVFREDITLDLNSELAALRIVTADMSRVRPDEDLRRTALNIELLISRIGRFGPVTYPSVCAGVSSLSVLHEILGTPAAVRAVLLRDQAAMLRRWLQLRMDGSLSARLEQSQETYDRAVLVGDFRSVSVAEIQYVQGDYVAVERVKVVKLTDRLGPRFVQSGPFRIDEIGLEKAAIAPDTVQIRFLDNPNLATRFDCFSLTRSVAMPGTSSGDGAVQQYIREQTKQYIDCMETFWKDYASRRVDLEQRRQNLIEFSSSIGESARILDDAANRLAPA